MLNWDVAVMWPKKLLGSVLFMGALWLLLVCIMMMTVGDLLLYYFDSGINKDSSWSHFGTLFLKSDLFSLTAICQVVGKHVCGISPQIAICFQSYFCGCAIILLPRWCMLVFQHGGSRQGSGSCQTIENVTFVPQWTVSSMDWGP